ncbi:MAG: hypothetical protein AAGF72_15475, partial [Pseudomonadota bacterium]
MRFAAKRHAGANFIQSVLRTISSISSSARVLAAAIFRAAEQAPEFIGKNAFPDHRHLNVANRQQTYLRVISNWQ